MAARESLSWSRVRPTSEAPPGAAPATTFSSAVFSMNPAARAASLTATAAALGLRLAMSSTVAMGNLKPRCWESACLITRLRRNREPLNAKFRARGPEHAHRGGDFQPCRGLGGTFLAGVLQGL